MRVPDEFLASLLILTTCMTSSVSYQIEAAEQDIRYIGEKESHRTKRALPAINSQEAEAIIRKNHRTVEMFLVCDTYCYDRLGRNKGKAEQFLYNIGREVDKRYSALNTAVRLVGVQIWVESNPIIYGRYVSGTMTEFLRYRRNFLLPNRWNDVAFLITGTKIRNSRQVLTGVVPPSGTCTQQNGGGVISFQGTERVEKLAETITHELGHTLGMDHDTSNCGCIYGNGNCVMATLLNSIQIEKYKWSDCSKRYFADFISKSQSNCLYNEPLKVFEPSVSSGNKCGNGVVDDEEECDCGMACNGGCCNCCKGCKLQKGGQCYKGDCCNTTTCRYKDCNTMCQAAADPQCSVDSYCSGDSDTCYTSHKPMGKICTDAFGTEGYCSRGVCLTSNAQCGLSWKQGYKAADSLCWEVATRGRFVGKKAHCGVDKHGKYIKCSKASKRNYKCGLLQCTGPDVTTAYRENQYRQASEISLGSSTCVTSNMYPWVRDEPNMVADGTRCGEDKACWKQDCIDKEDVYDLLALQTEDERKREKVTSVCGDGVVEGSEECDCGAVSDCGCCDMITCKVLPAASTCQSNECKSCDGRSHRCEDNANDFRLCARGEGSCFNGTCNSLQLACEKYYAPGVASPNRTAIGDNTRKDITSVNNGGGIIVWDNSRRKWISSERVQAKGDGLCGTLLCIVTDIEYDTGTVKGSDGTTLKSQTFYSSAVGKKTKVIYYVSNNLVQNSNSLDIYSAVLSPQGTPCTANGKPGHCIHSIKQSEKFPDVSFKYGICKTG